MRATTFARDGYIPAVFTTLGKTMAEGHYKKDPRPAFVVLAINDRDKEGEWCVYHADSKEEAAKRAFIDYGYSACWVLKRRDSDSENELNLKAKDDPNLGVWLILGRLNQYAAMEPKFPDRMINKLIDIAYPYTKERGQLYYEPKDCGLQ